MSAAGTPLDVFVLPHTHWDREWYQPVGRFRQRLVALVDELLDDPVPPPGSFLLDGQGAVLEDYLAVRPERRDALAAALRAGRLEAGPWFVLADELMPSGEALVRNLLAGRRTLAALDAEPPPVLYSPDAFGHTAALPTLADEFGCAITIAWRGYGGARWPAGDAAWWRAPSGATTLLVHLPPDGYEFGSSLPADPRRAAERWTQLHAVLAPRARLGLLLVQNGADHHARQRRWTEAVAALREAAAPHHVRHGSLRGLASEARGRAELAALPTVGGELRDSYGYTWTLQGTFATRAQQKRRNAHAQRLLERDAEPWLALLALGAGDDARRRALLHAAWRTLLLVHPHDTLCGCSTDEVARAADARLDDALAQGVGLRDDALARLLGHDADAAREQRSAWRPCLVVRNRAARARGGVAEVRLDTFVRDVSVGPGSAGLWRAIQPLGATPRVRDGDIELPVQILERTLRHDRVEAPRHYPDDDLVESADAVVWVPSLAGYELRAFPLGGRAPDVAGEGPSHPVRTGDGTLDNGILGVAVDARGRVSLRSAHGRIVPANAAIDSLLGFEDVGDAGDTYTHSPVRAPLTAVWFGGVKTVHRGPLRGTVELRYRLRVPAALRVEPDGDPFSRPAKRAGRHVELPLAVRLTLDADAPFVRVEVRGENGARDHRLRVVFRTGVSGDADLADAALGPVERRPIEVPPEDAAAERPPRTAPLHRWVARSDGTRTAALFSDGLAEYEVDAEGAMYVTLVRAVGELSRPDLPERPGHAGWPVSTPEAQCLGAFEASFAIALLDGALDAGAIDRLADEVLLPLCGETLRPALVLPPPAGGLTLEGDGLSFSAAKPSDDGVWVVLRCVNVTEREVRGAWRVRAVLAEAATARLDETPLAPLVVSAHGAETVVPIVVGPRGVSTVLVR